jgi:hypothetical protein
VIASIPAVAGGFSQGQTREQTRANVIDALRLMRSPVPRQADDEREPLRLTIAAPSAAIWSANYALMAAVRSTKAATTDAGLRL